MLLMKQDENDDDIKETVNFLIKIRSVFCQFIVIMILVLSLMLNFGFGFIWNLNLKM